jgi:hypothetical protein
VKETVVDRTAEANHHNHGEQQRHREIEISIHDPFELGHRARFFFTNRCSPAMFRTDDRDRHMNSCQGPLKAPSRETV